MVDPVSAISLAALAGHLLKNIYNVCAELAEAPEHLKELCTEVLALQEALGRISTICQFPSRFEKEKILPRFTTPDFQSMMKSTEEMVQDLLQRCDIPKSRFQSVKQRFRWVLEKADVQETLQAIERRKDYFTMVLSTTSHDYLQKILTEVKSLTQHNTLEFRKDLATWLDPPDYSARHFNYLTARRSGTGSWYINGPLATWISNAKDQTEVAWLRGKSGCGKSFISSYAIEWASTQSRARGWHVLYFHCSFQDVSTQSLRAVLASLIHQMCEHQPSLWTKVNSSKHLPTLAVQSGTNASSYHLEQLFVELAVFFPQLYIFLDALDESPHENAIIEFLSRAISSNRRMRLIISSKPSISIHLVHNAGIRYSYIDMDATKQRQDFETYIAGYLQDDESLHYLRDDLKGLIVSQLSTKADGSFRWVDCQLQSLSDQASVEDVRTALRTLPPSLERYYRETMAKVPVKDRVHVRRLLRWLFTQNRPMTSKELSAAVVLDAADTSTVLSEDKALFPGKIERYLRAISSLVHYDSGTQRVSLAHSSVQEFLSSTTWSSDRDLQEFGSFHYAGSLQAVLYSCLWYLNQDQFSQNPQALSAEVILARWPLYDYCAHAWIVLVQQLSSLKEDINEGNKALLRRLFDSRHRPGGGSYVLWLRHYENQYVPKPGQRWPVLSPLHLAAGRGWLTLVQLICAYDKRDIDAVSGGTLLTPLLRACCYNQSGVAQWLLSIGVNPMPPAVQDRYEAYLSNCDPTIAALVRHRQAQLQTAGK